MSRLEYFLTCYFSNHLAVEDGVGSFGCKCSVSLPWGWSAVCDCNIYWSLIPPSIRESLYAVSLACFAHF